MQPETHPPSFSLVVARHQSTQSPSLSHILANQTTQLIVWAIYAASISHWSTKKAAPVIIITTAIIIIIIISHKSKLSQVT